MQLGDIIYLCLRATDFCISGIAAVAGIVYARKVLSDASRAALLLAGSTIVFAGGSLSMYDAALHFRARPDAGIPGEDWFWLIVDITLPVLFLLLLRVSRRRDQAEAELRLLSITDALTGLVNRRGFETLALPALARARRLDAPSAMVMADLDHFKLVNDTNGHAAGDEVLRALARIIAETVRASDVPARIGGEEFAVFLPETTLENACSIAERLRAEVSTGIEHPSGAEARVTMSCGVAVVGEDTGAGALDEALAAADRALYAAKRAGRNRVEVAPPPPNRAGAR
jgi:diguanylate cyclase (GGDEF)-like protein